MLASRVGSSPSLGVGLTLQSESLTAIPELAPTEALKADARLSSFVSESCSWEQCQCKLQYLHASLVLPLLSVQGEGKEGGC